MRFTVPICLAALAGGCGLPPGQVIDLEAAPAGPTGHDVATTPVAPPADEVLEPIDGTLLPPETERTPVSAVPVEINAGWIGGACSAPADCSDPNLNAPICARDGFPNGFCTQACHQSPSTGNWICPDTTYEGTSATTSRCIDAAGEPRCVAECDATKSPTGCRPGYTCVTRSRFGQPDTTFSVCLPAESGAWPGEVGPATDVGQACLADGECEHEVCIKLQGGYCSKADCQRNGCPDGSTCFLFGQPPTQTSMCLDACTSDADCRTAEGYRCDADHVCWPSPRPVWNAAVGPADCADWWGRLSPCDTTPDDYVVVRKSARNVAVCRNGANLTNYHGALGFAPIGDKQQSGDGKTPEGVFYIPRRLATSSFYKAFLLSYPDQSDALRGRSAGLISEAERQAIVAAQQGCSEPPQSTTLGGFIELHGSSRTGADDWTHGCIAVENAQVDELWSILSAKDTIVVIP